MKHGSLFSGIDSFGEAAKSLGIDNVISLCYTFSFDNFDIKYEAAKGACLVTSAQTDHFGKAVFDAVTELAEAVIDFHKNETKFVQLSILDEIAERAEG